MDPQTATVFLNAATVPRVRPAGPAGAAAAKLHHLLLVDVADGQVESASDVWVRVRPLPPAAAAPSDASGAQPGREQAGGADCEVQYEAVIAEQQEVLGTIRNEDGEAVVKRCWDASRGCVQLVTIGSDVSPFQQQPPPARPGSRGDTKAGSPTSKRDRRDAQRGRRRRRSGGSSSDGSSSEGEGEAVKLAAAAESKPS